MALHQSQQGCAACGAAVDDLDEVLCADCAEGNASEDTSEDPTVIAPPGGLWARMNTDESLEQPVPPKSIPPTPLPHAERGQPDTELPAGEVPTWLVLGIGGLTLAALATTAALLLSI